MQKLERLLTRWINSHIELNMNLSFLIIKEKAMLLFEDLVMVGWRDSRLVLIFKAFVHQAKGQALM
jgi:hypothetical protein